jgi:CRISPR-associated protein Cmr3
MADELVLCPRDGLTLKDARGFNLAGGVTAGGLPWPGPATLAGAARTVVGRLSGHSEVVGEDRDRWQQLAKTVGVGGPVILCRPVDGERWVPLWPAPLDALRTPDPDAQSYDAPQRSVWLEPKPRADAGASVCGSWIAGASVGPNKAAEVVATEALDLPLMSDRQKPLEPRQLWLHDEMLAWLSEPRTRDEQPAPQPSERLDVHLSVNPETLASRDEHLYVQSTYQSLVRIKHEQKAYDYELGLGLRVCGVESDLDLTQPFWRLGGEARFATAYRLHAEVLAPPNHLLRRWRETRFLRLVMITPACFRGGWRPDWLAAEATDVGHRFQGALPVTGHQVRLRAAFVDRPQWLSGWDMLAHGPKPSVACVPAGAVYYLQSLAEPFTKTHIEQLWLATLQSADTQLARDGFGLVLPGAWPNAV